MMNVLEIIFSAKTENISLMRTLTGVILADKNVTISFLDEIQTIVSEAITNAIVHGYQGNEEKFVKYMIEINEEEVVLHFLDDGVGIADIAEARKPLFSTKKDEERSGLGFTIMEVFSDGVEVISNENEGCHVVVHKSLMYN